MDISYNYKQLQIFDSTKKIIEKTKNDDNIPTLEVIEVVLVQCNLVNNQYQQKSEVLYIFYLNKSYVYLAMLNQTISVFKIL